MIRFTDTIVLAFTKLRTRKIRTIVTVTTASLLFGGLVASTLLIGGIVDSTKRFSTGGLSERFISQIQYYGMDDFAYNPPESVIDRAEELYQKRITDKKAAAKRLGLEYDSAAEPKPISKVGYEPEYFDPSNPSASQALAEYKDTLPTKLDKLKKTLTPYNSKNIYTVDGAVINGFMKPLKDGKEDFKKAVNMSQDYSGSSTPVELGWSYIDSSVVSTFMLDKAAIQSQPDQTSMPVIGPYSKVEEALGLKKLTDSATVEQRLERIRLVRNKAATVRFSTCYRNQSSQDLIDQAIQVAKDIETNKTNKDYQKPSLIYGLPTADSCGAAVVIRDVRTKAEKAMAENELQFRREFGEYTDPAQQKLTFRIIGITPDSMGMNDFSTIPTLITMVAGASLNGMWVVPRDSYEELSNKADYEKFLPNDSFVNAGYRLEPSFLVEFNNVKDTRAFSANEACTGFDCSGSKPYVSYFGSNSALIQDFLEYSTRTIAIAAIVVVAVAALILMGMIGRVIGDSRRETAVFRAIGAKRNDIRAIYTTYTLMLGLLIVLSAIAIGVLVVLWADSKWSGVATAQALITFSGADDSQVFHLIGVWWPALGAIVFAVLLAAFTSMLLPLARNLARSPIRDMRDDT